MDTYPRQAARTRRYSLGLPTRFHVARDGARVVFLRSRGGDDPTAGLWVLDADGRERVVYDADRDAELTDEERDRRERTGERLEGVTGFSADPDALTAVFVSGGRLLLADLEHGVVRPLEGAAPGAFDPRIDPTGRRVAYVADGALRVTELETGTDRVLAEDPDPDVSWGVAEFVAAEEMDRLRGFWWAPDGGSIAVARVDDRPVTTWHIADPIDPSRPPRAVRYPRAGTANAIVTLHVLGLDGSRADAGIDVDAFPYLATVDWNEHGSPLAWVQSRDQRTALVLGIDPASGDVTTLREDRDDHWIHLVGGVPTWLPGGRLLHVRDREDTRRLEIDGEPATPAGLHVQEVIDAGEELWFLGTDDPTQMHVWRLAGSGGEPARVTDEAGIHTAAASGAAAVIVSDLPESPIPTTRLVRDGAPDVVLRAVAETPILHARPSFHTAGHQDLRCAVLTPGGEEPDRPLPVLVDPYGGPHFNRVLRSQRIHRESQWWADQGFVVVVADGRGTMHRGTAWERAIHLDLADPVLEDQVDALHGIAGSLGFLDLSRVAIRGWSFGGYLACLAVMRRPDVFHAAVAGAPSVDLSLYDTHYTERYLGHPEDDPDVYRRNSVIEDAAKLERPLLLIHGMTDDNVFVAHTLALSKALMEAGRPHSVLPLSGITHRPVDERLAENLLLIELAFVREALGIDA